MPLYKPFYLYRYFFLVRTIKLSISGQEKHSCYYVKRVKFIQEVQKQDMLMFFGAPLSMLIFTIFYCLEYNKLNKYFDNPSSIFSKVLFLIRFRVWLFHLTSAYPLQCNASTNEIIKSHGVQTYARDFYSRQTRLYDKNVD